MTVDWRFAAGVQAGIICGVLLKLPTEARENVSHVSARQNQRQNHRSKERSKDSPSERGKDQCRSALQMKVCNVSYRTGTRGEVYIVEGRRVTLYT